MTSRRSVRLFFVLMAALPFSMSTAQQNLDTYGAYAALVGTTPGALPPILTSTILGTLQRTTQFSVRYGYMRRLADPETERGFDVGANNFAATVVLPMGLGSTVSLSAGAWYPSEADYTSHLMLSVGGDYRIGGAPISDMPTAPTMTVSLNGEVGYGKPRNESLWSAAIGAPIALVTRGTGMRIAPFVTPGIGFGTITRSDAGGTHSGVRLMVGGGVGFYNPASTVSVNLGFHQVFIRGSSTLVGAVLSLGSR